MADKEQIKPKRGAASSLNDLFEDCLKDALWAENALVDALPLMIENATSKDLKNALKDHLKETKAQVKSLKDIFKSIGVKAEEEKCDAMAGLLKEGEGIIKGTEPGHVRDAGIIAACRKVKHYEIASYDTMVTYAQLLGHKEAKTMLQDLLKEEKAADKLLGDLAKTTVPEEKDSDKKTEATKDKKEEKSTNVSKNTKATDKKEETKKSEVKTEAKTGKNG